MSTMTKKQNRFLFFGGIILASLVFAFIFGFTVQGNERVELPKVTPKLPVPPQAAPAATASPTTHPPTAVTTKTTTSAADKSTNPTLPKLPSQPNPASLSRPATQKDPSLQRAGSIQGSNTSLPKVKEPVVKSSTSLPALPSTVKRKESVLLPSGPREKGNIEGQKPSELLVPAIESALFDPPATEKKESKNQAGFWNPNGFVVKESEQSRERRLRSGAGYTSGTGQIPVNHPLPGSANYKESPITDADSQLAKREDDKSDNAGRNSRKLVSKDAAEPAKDTAGQTPGPLTLQDLLAEARNTNPEPKVSASQEVLVYRQTGLFGLDLIPREEAPWRHRQENATGSPVDSQETNSSDFASMALGFIGDSNGNQPIQLELREKSTRETVPLVLQPVPVKEPGSPSVTDSDQTSSMLMNTGNGNQNGSVNSALGTAMEGESDWVASVPLPSSGSDSPFWVEELPSDDFFIGFENEAEIGLAESQLFVGIPAKDDQFVLQTVTPSKARPAKAVKTEIDPVLPPVSPLLEKNISELANINTDKTDSTRIDVVKTIPTTRTPVIPPVTSQKTATLPKIEPKDEQVIRLKTSPLPLNKTASREPIAITQEESRRIPTLKNETGRETGKLTTVSKSQTLPNSQKPERVSLLRQSAQQVPQPSPIRDDSSRKTEKPSFFEAKKTKMTGSNDTPENTALDYNNDSSRNTTGRSARSSVPGTYAAASEPKTRNETGYSTPLPKTKEKKNFRQETSKFFSNLNPFK